MINNLETISSALEHIGFNLESSEPGAMDSGVAIYSNGKKQIKVVKDIGQWMLQGAKHELEPKGLYQAFDDTIEFKNVLVNFIHA